MLVDEILESKRTIKKHYESLNAVDKIEINEAIEKLELRITGCENEIDAIVYKLYGLSDEEIGLVETKNIALKYPKISTIFQTNFAYNKTAEPEMNFSKK